MRNCLVIPSPNKLRIGPRSDRKFQAPSFPISIPLLGMLRSALGPKFVSASSRGGSFRMSQLNLHLYHYQLIEWRWEVREFNWQGVEKNGWSSISKAHVLRYSEPDDRANHFWQVAEPRGLIDPRQWPANAILIHINLSKYVFLLANLKYNNTWLVLPCSPWPRHVCGMDLQICLIQIHIDWSGWEIGVSASWWRAYIEYTDSSSTAMNCCTLHASCTPGRIPKYPIVATYSLNPWTTWNSYLRCAACNNSSW